MMQVIIAYLLNIIDYIFTDHWVRKFGIKIEANPIGRWLYETGAVYAVKVVGVGLLLLVLYHALKAKTSWGWVSWLPLVAYSALALYHIFIIFYLKGG